MSSLGPNGAKCLPESAFCRTWRRNHSGSNSSKEVLPAIYLCGRSAIHCCTPLGFRSLCGRLCMFIRRVTRNISGKQQMTCGVCPVAGYFCSSCIAAGSGFSTARCGTKKLLVAISSCIQYHEIFLLRHSSSVKVTST